MKKIYLFSAFVLFAGLLLAQGKITDISLKNKYAQFETVVKKTVAHTAKGVTIWSNDFSNGANWTLNNTSSPLLDWCFTTAADTIPVTALSPALFTTVANGFAFINSDAQGQNGNQNANMTYTGMIDCSSYPNVSLVLEQSYRTYNDIRIVRISNNGGTTWNDFFITDGTEPTAQNSANPDIASVNISGIAGGHDSVMVQLNYQGNWGWYWAVDDIKIIETDPYDLKLRSLQWGTDGAFGKRLAYYQIPTAQIAPIHFGGIAQNIGVQNIANVIYTANINAIYSGQSSPTAIAAGAEDTLWCTATFTPAATVASHAVQVNVGSSQAELDMTNNTLADINISVNNYIYARDRDVISGGLYNSGQGFEAGPAYDIFTSATLYGIDGVIGATASEGAEIFAKLYYVNPATGIFDFVDESLPYVLTAADLGQKHTFALQTPQALLAGETYLAMLGSYGDGGASNDLVVAAAGGAPASTVYYYDYTDQTWYYTSSQAMVRMNFDQAAGIQTMESTNAMQLLPNPANTWVTLSLAAPVAGDLTLVDLAGKVVYTAKMNGVTATVATQNLMNGVYFVTVTDGKNTTSQKLMIQN